MISDEVNSRFGRAGRGRLRVPQEIDLNGIEWKETALANQLAQRYGGIVFFEKVKSAPFDASTIITNLELEEI